MLSGVLLARIGSPISREEDSDFTIRPLSSTALSRAVASSSSSSPPPTTVAATEGSEAIRVCNGKNPRFKRGSKEFTLELAVVVVLLLVAVIDGLDKICELVRILFLMMCPAPKKPAITDPNLLGIFITLWW